MARAQEPNGSDALFGEHLGPEAVFLRALRCSSSNSKACGLGSWCMMMRTPFIFGLVFLQALYNTIITKKQDMVSVRILPYIPPQAPVTKCFWKPSARSLNN